MHYEFGRDRALGEAWRLVEGCRIWKLDAQLTNQTNRFEYSLPASNEFSVLANFAAESEDIFFTAAAPHNAKLRPVVKKAAVLMA